MSHANKVIKMNEAAETERVSCETFRVTTAVQCGMLWTQLLLCCCCCMYHPRGRGGGWAFDELPSLTTQSQRHLFPITADAAATAAAAYGWRVFLATETDAGYGFSSGYGYGSGAGHD